MHTRSLAQERGVSSHGDTSVCLAGRGAALRRLSSTELVDMLREGGVDKGLPAQAR